MNIAEFQIHTASSTDLKVGQGWTMKIGKASSQLKSTWNYSGDKQGTLCKLKNIFVS